MQTEIPCPGAGWGERKGVPCPSPGLEREVGCTLF